MKKIEHEKIYQIYVTDALKSIAENTGTYLIPGHGAIEAGARMSMKYADLISGKEIKQKKQETADEVIARISGKLRAIGN